MDPATKQHYLQERGLDVVPLDAWPSEDIWRAWRDETIHFWQCEQNGVRLKAQLSSNGPLTAAEQSLLDVDLGEPQSAEDALAQILATHPEFKADLPIEHPEHAQPRMQQTRDEFFAHLESLAEDVRNGDQGPTPGL
jgi:cytochrome P450